MRNFISRQQGGTLVGVIIGLIVGLGIALVVAVAVTKTPMPFVTKVIKPEKADPGAGQITDPNKALYGNKTAAKEAAKTFNRESKETESAAADPIAQVVRQKEAQPPNTAVAAVDPALTDKPKATEIKIPESRPAESKSPSIKEAVRESTPKNDAGDDKWTYFLQAGAFREPNDAENTRAKLALMGVEARIMEKQSENGTLYRVRIGPFAQLDALNKVRGKLSDNGVDAAVVRIAKQN